jgi:hypothetical protein
MNIRELRSQNVSKHCALASDFGIGLFTSRLARGASARKEKKGFF